MELHLTKNSPINTTLVNSDGQILYKVDTPFALGKRTTTVDKVLLGDSSSEKGETESVFITSKDGKDMEKESMVSVPVLKDNFSRIADIEWRNICSNTLHFGGAEQEATSFLKPLGFASQHRVFTASDGRQYKWNMGCCGMKPPMLEVNELDGSWKCVAKFHRKHFGIIHKARKGYLEIFPEGQHLLDTIVVTFVYVDHVRRKKKAAARAAMAAGVAGGSA